MFKGVKKLQEEEPEMRQLEERIRYIQKQREERRKNK